MSDISTLRLSDWIARDKSPEEIKRQEKISELLSFLSVPENPDVERFAHKNAIPYEKANKGRTYILVDENSYPLAYFTLGLGRLEYSADISGSLWKKLRGVGDGDATVLTCILLGQLARNHGVSYDSLPKGCLFNEMMNAVYQGQSFVGGRFLLAECNDDLIGYYEKKGFIHLYKNSNNSLNQMILLL